MSTRPRSRLLALLLSVIPGWGHVYWGREISGLAAFTAFAAAGFAFLNGLFIYLGEGKGALIWVSASLAIGLLVGAWVDLLRRTSPRWVKAEEEERQKNMRSGTVAYLRGDHETAGNCFASCVKADPSDVEALFRLGIVCARSGDLKRAKSSLRRVKRYDVEGKWGWEVEMELKQILQKTDQAKKKTTTEAGPGSG